MFYYIGGSAGAGIPGTFWARGGWPACVALIAGVQIVIIVLATLFWQSGSPVASTPVRELAS